MSQVILLLYRLQHEKEQVFEAGAFLQQLWEDPRLKWEPSKYGGLTEVHLPASKVWKPDIVLINRYACFVVVFPSHYINLLKAQMSLNPKQSC